MEGLADGIEDHLGQGDKTVSWIWRFGNIGEETNSDWQIEGK